MDAGPNDYIDIALDVLSLTLEFDLGFADLVSTTADTESVYDQFVTFVLPGLTTLESFSGHKATDVQQRDASGLEG